jgi:hypothetical protein
MRLVMSERRADTTGEAVERVAVLLDKEGIEYTTALLRALLAERDAARADAERMRRVVSAADEYFHGYLQDEAEDIDVCLGQRQHEMARELRDALAALSPSKEPQP